MSIERIFIRRRALLTAPLLAFLSASAAFAETSPMECQPHVREVFVGPVSAQVKTARAQLALTLLQSAGTSPPTNLALSPLGVSRILTTLFLGANPTMRKAILQTLALKDAKQLTELSDSDRYLSVLAGHDKAPLDMVDALLVDNGQTLKPGVEDAIRDEAEIMFERVGFSKPDAITKINDLVAQKTHGRIASILDPGTPPALVALNAFSFKDCWRQKFDAAQTQAQPFHRLDGTSAERPLMRMDDQDLGLAVAGRFQAVELPYADERFALTAIVATDKPTSLADYTGDKTVLKLLSEPALKRVPLRLKLPKFTGTGGYDLLPALAAMGLKSGLSDLGALSGFGDGLHLAAVKQKTFIALDEAGTEAAAATAAVVERSMQVEPARIEVKFDTPFIYALRHRATGAILMIGYVDDPGGS